MAVALIELDASTRQCVWSYPSIDNGTEQQLITRASQVDERSNVFFFSKHKQVWQYYLAVPGPTDGPAKVVTLCLLSAQFAPEKCEALLRVLATQYVGSGCNPQAVLASYLEVFTQKQVGKATPLWRVADFDEKTPLLGGSLSDVSEPVVGIVDGNHCSSRRIIRCASSPLEVICVRSYLVLYFVSFFFIFRCVLHRW